MPAEHRQARRLKSFTLARIRLERLQHDLSGAFFVGLEETLQREHLDLAVVAVESSLHRFLFAQHHQQRLSFTTPTRTGKAFDQTDERDLRFVFSSLLLQRVAIPVKRGVE